MDVKLSNALLLPNVVALRSSVAAGVAVVVTV